MSNIAITVDGLGKRYRIGLREQRHDTLTGAMLSWVRSPLSNFRQLRKLSAFETHEDAEDIIWALRDVTFEVRKGEVMGIIGRNGAGKSTLLKVLSCITEPTTGRAVINGRVASLLEVGTGFHPELTGRENVYLNGTILGMTKVEVDRKFDEIVSFSGVEKFIDTPVKRYSSGMMVRLAFAVAAHLEPEILLIDEVLAVGDLAFQKKCLGKMSRVAREGRTVLFVSHNMGAVSNLCEQTLWIHEGRLHQQGATDEIVSAYVHHNASLSGEYFCATETGEGRTNELVLKEVRICNDSGQVVNSMDVTKPFWIEIVYDVVASLPHCRVGIFVSTLDGTIVFDSYDADIAAYLGAREPGTFISRCTIPSDFLMPGGYVVTVNADMPGIKRLVRLENVLMFEVHNTGAVGTEIGGRRRGLILPKLQWAVEPVAQRAFEAS